MTVCIEQRFRIVNSEGWEHIVTQEPDTHWVEIQYRDDTRMGSSELAPKLQFDQQDLKALIEVLQKLVK